MKKELITLTDERFHRLAFHAIASARQTCFDEWDPVVYNFGFGHDAAAWFRSHGIDASFIPCDTRRLLPLAISEHQRRFDLYTSKQAAILDAAENVGDSGLVAFVDADLVFLENASAWASTIEPISNGVFDVAVASDVMSIADYTDRAAWTADPAEWGFLFGQPLDAVDQITTYNIGIIVASSLFLRRLAPTWASLTALWANSDVAARFPMPCFDQLSFFAALHRLDARVLELPFIANCTRPMYNDPRVALDAQVLHLTGPIKPWQPAGRTHPMTLRYVERTNGIAERIRESKLEAAPG